VVGGLWSVVGGFWFWSLVSGFAIAGPNSMRESERAGNRGHTHMRQRLGRACDGVPVVKPTRQRVLAQGLRSFEPSLGRIVARPRDVVDNGADTMPGTTVGV
jgi:hypothetical protein